MRAPIRIAFDVTFPNRNLAGSGVYALDLLDALRERDDVAMTAETADPGSGLLGTMRWLTGGARGAAAKAQLVHCPAFVAPWRLGRPFVLTVHDTSTLKFPEDHTLEWREYARFFLPQRARSASRVITGTEYSRRDIVRDLKVPAERIEVTPYGVAERFKGRPDRSPAVADPALLLFPGSPTRRKNLELVLNAMAHSPRETALRRARLAISGAEAGRFPVHKARIRELGLESRVEWLGKIPAQSMPDLIARAELVVYPSHYEGFGFPGLEAMAVGTPVIASNASCLPEVLGTAALLVDPNDVRHFSEAAESALTNMDLRRDLIARGKAHAAGYTWRRCADLTVDVYRKALSLS